MDIYFFVTVCKIGIFVGKKEDNPTEQDENTPVRKDFPPETGD
jgi:hypothetical protein